MGLLWRRHLPNAQERRALAALAEAERLFDAMVAAGHCPWPGWTFWQRPVALYSADGYALLAARGAPPEGAEPVHWPEGASVGFAVWRVPEVPPRLGGAVTTVPCGGTETVFVPSAAVGETPVEAVRFVVRLWEALFQAHLRRWPEKWRHRMIRRGYPDDVPANNALGILEGLVLHEALTGEGEGDLARQALTFALVRRERRATLDDVLIRFEDANEFSEGLPTYVGFRVLAFAAEPPHACGEPFRAETGLDRLRPAVELLEERLRSLRPLGRPGDGAARQRFFFSGMGLALLLDRLDPVWQRAVEERHATLTSVLERHVTFDGGERDEQLLAEVQRRFGYVEMLQREREYARELRERKRQLLKEVLGANGTLFVFDVSQLSLTGASWDLDAVESITDRLRVHTGRSFFRFGAATLAFDGVPVVEDRRSGLLHARIPGRRVDILADASRLSLLRPAAFSGGFELDASGVSVRAHEGYLQRIDEGLYVRITR